MGQLANDRLRATLLAACLFFSVFSGLPVGTAAANTTANVSYSDLSIAGNSMYAGSSVEGSLRVENAGNDAGTYSVSLAVDGTTVEQKSGTVAGNTATIVTITETLWEIGDRSVTVAGGGASATQTVTVKNANPKYHGGPRNLGNYPNQQGPLATPVEAWNLSDGTPHVMQSTIVGDTLYTAFHDGGKFYALDPETGAEKWNATPGGGSGSTWTTPAYANGVLYIGSNDYKLHAIDATDGSELWNYSTQTNVRSAPAVVDGVVYFGSNGGNMTAVNATTGEEIWHHTLYQPLLVESNPAVVDGVVYFGGNDDNVTALNATDGSLVWNFSMVDESQSDPTVVNDTVYIGSDSTAGQTSGDGQVYALNATDGTKRWNYTMAGDVDSGQVYADGVLYAGSRGGDFVALNATDGSLVWNVSGSGFRGAPVVADGVVYVSDFGNGTVHAFDADDGTQLWEYASPTANLYPTPLVWNGYLYYGSGSHFYALTEPAPAISDVTANPSGQSIDVWFNSSQQLTNLSVSVSGPVSTTFTEADFTEYGSGPYTYVLASAYDTGTDGTYTVSVDTAENAEGQDGATGESDTVVVDTVAPTISNFTVTNSTDKNVTVSFDSSERLSSVYVSLSGPEWQTLTLANFTESGSGPYDYTAVYDGSSNGTYTATLESALDAGDNDGSSGQTDSVSIGRAVLDSQLRYVSGTKPDVSNLTLDARFSGGLLQVQVKNATANESDFDTEPDYELAGLGADDTTVLRTNVTVQQFVPRVLIGSAHDVNWTRTDNGDGTWTISITGTPAAVESYFEADGSSPTTWPGTLQANESQDAAFTLAVDDLGVMSSQYRDRLDGSIMSTDAQEFGSPRYNTSGATDKVELHVKGPHFAEDGANNTGFFEAYLPQTLLDDWGVSATQLAGELNGQSRKATVRAVPGGGARVEFTVHYSEADAAITVDTTAPTADAGPDRTVDEDTSVSFDATNSSDNTSIASYEWDFGDGSANATGATPTHTFADPGTYTVVLNVTDDAGNSDLDTLTVTAEDATPPTATAGNDQTVSFGQSVTVDASGSSDNIGIATYSWDFGDGNVSSGVSATHTYSNPGEYAVTLTVTDADANSATDTLNVTVSDDTAPTADAGPNRTADEDTSVSFDATNSSDDVGIDTYSWDFGDGQTATGTKPTHTFADPGNYTVTLTVTDAGGNGATDTLVVAVNDTTPPVAEAGNNVTVEKGTNVSFDATNSTDNDAIAGYSWAFGDDDTATGATATHTYSDRGTYTVTLTVTDAAGFTSNDTRTVTVTKPEKSRNDRNRNRRPTTPDPNPGEKAEEKAGVNVTERTNATGDAAAFDAKVENAAANSTVVFDFAGARNESGEQTGRDSGETDDSANTTRPGADAFENVSVTGMSMNVTRSGDFTLNVTTRSIALNGTGTETTGEAAGENETDAASDSDDQQTDRGRNRTNDYQTTDGLSEADREFAAETGARPAGYVVVNHTIDDRDIENVSFTFEVRKSYLHATGGDPDSVRLYRNEHVRWRTLPTTRVGETETHYVFEAVSPGLSEFTIGVSSPLFELNEVETDATRVAPGEEMTVTAVVTNLGAANGTYDLTVSVDGESVATEAVSVPGRTNRTVTIPVAFDTAGTYDVRVGGKSAGSIRVEALQTTTTTTETTTTEPATTTTATTDPDENGSGFGWLWIVALVAFVGVGGLLYQRR